VIYPSSFEQKIGFDKIRYMVSDLCLSSSGRRKVEEMKFLSSPDLIEPSLRMTEEMKEILLSPSLFPSAHYYDMSPLLKQLKIEGTFPLPEEGFDLLRSLNTLLQITQFFSKQDKHKYPYLRNLSEQIKIDLSLLQLLNRIYTQEGTIHDHASPRLAEIRKKLHALRQEVSQRMNQIIKTAQAEGWIDNDLSVSVRDGRPVIPLLSQHKRKLKGIIHDESSSGKTVFIEPEEIVELNNFIRETEHEEKREIVSILTQLANTMRPSLNEMIAWYDFLGTIDFIRAKALFAIQINAHLPSLISSPGLSYYEAIHPLLYLHFKQEGKTVVPLHITLNSKQRLLVISGPNAGGKSVCLQTVGLLQYMLQCGMLIPCKPASEAGVFEHIFLDMGDEQSIESDLSTYSSRLMNMKHFLKHANPRTLILIDEFGSGTEPVIGGAIAEAILQALNQKGCYGVVTTHYSNLKHYAMTAEGIVNGAMLYDTARMQPLFILQTGEPGSSFAFEIARQIGLPEDILKEAEKKAGEEHILFDKHLREILRDKYYWERKRESIKDNEKKLNELLERYEKELHEIAHERKIILEKAKREAEEILAKANKQIEQTIREIKEAQAEKEKTQKARKDLLEVKKTIENYDLDKKDMIEHKMELIRQRQQRKLERSRQFRKKEEDSLQEKSQSSEIRKGDKVRIPRFPHLIAEVADIIDDTVFLHAGNMQLTVQRNEVEKITSKNTASAPPSSLSNPHMEQISRKRFSFKTQLDIRGMRGDEAMKAVAAYIDEAIMLGVNEVSILHGKGNGILRQLVRSYLKGIKEIESFADAHVEKGGAGITEIKFK